MIEVWKEIKGYEGFYEVSNFGRVRTISRTVSTPYGINRTIPQRILKVGTSQDRPHVCLSKECRARTTRIHKLVAYAFLGSPPGEYGYKKGCWYIRHLDGDYANNHVSNLQWYRI